jgi:hypothetical protein
MIEHNELKPGGTYLFTKEILDNNVWFPQNRKRWILETYRKNLRVFILPVGKVLGYSIVKNKLMVVIEFHSKSVMEKVPRQCKDQVYELYSDDIDSYRAGKMPPIAEPDTLTYKGKDMCGAMRKRVANSLQSLTIRYNRHFGRKDRLSARFTGIFELETEEDIRNVLAEIQNAPLIHSDRRDLKRCDTNSFHLEDASIRQVVSTQRVLDLFGGSLIAFQEAARSVRKKLLEKERSFKILSQIPPGRYLQTG